MTYLDFLKTKVEVAPISGFSIDPSELSEALKPHQRDAVIWALNGGRRALFESFGLGKTLQELEYCRLVLKHQGGKALIVLPLGVRQEFKRDAVNLLHIEEPEYITVPEQATEDGKIYMTNYERVRDGEIDPKAFSCCVLDEAAVLRSFGSKTYQTFLPKFKGVKYKLVATATPAPNRLKELIHYAGFLEVMETGQALTRFFQRDSTKANNLTLYPHKVEEFWLWVSSWALFISKPSDLGYDDEGYILPEMEIVTHVLSNPEAEHEDKDGQYKFMNDATASLSEASREKRESIEARANEVKAILTAFVKETLDEHEGISEEISCGASGRTERETTGTRKNLLSGTQRGNKSQKQEMGRRTSGENEGTSTEESGKRPREEKSPVETVVSRQQGEGGGQLQEIEAPDTIRDFSGNLRCYDGRTEVALPDLRSGTEQGRNCDESADRPQSRDGAGPGDSLYEMQLRSGDVQRFSASVDESCRLFGGQVVLWADLNSEQRRMELVCKELGLSYVSIYGSDKDADKLSKIEAWRDKKATVFISKGEMYGCGVNFQQAHKMIFSGIDYKFHTFIQSIHRVYRFLQEHPVTVDIIYTEAEDQIYRVLMEKWQLHNEQQERMRDIVRKYGLNESAQAAKMCRSIGVEEMVIEGNNFKAIHGDCVEETQKMEENSVDMILTSIPFSNHYEYTPSYNDFGHNENTARFFEQMDFLSPELLRILRPGRVFACHVKDRVLFGNATGTGMPTMEPFHAMCIEHYMKHGFQYFGMITIVTDVVRENNQTYRLGWTEQCKDGTKMGVGCPEYVLLFRKLPTDTSTAYADVPVVKSKEEYTRAQWQIDAHGFWRDGGNRLLTKEEIMNMPVDRLQAVYRKFSRDNVYDYAEHVEMCKKLDAEGHLPATFMVMAPGSWNADVWDDINRMLTLNTTQSQRRQALHVCPLQFETVDRLINRYSNEGDLIFDPFGGVGTVPLRALKLGRKGMMTELNEGYFRDAVGYLHEEEDKRDVPTLFDLMDVGA